MSTLTEANLEYSMYMYVQILFGPLPLVCKWSIHGNVSSAWMDGKWYIWIIHYLTNSEIIECDKTSHKFTIQEVVSCIDGPETWVCVVVGIHTEAERALWKKYSIGSIITKYRIQSTVAKCNIISIIIVYNIEFIIIKYNIGSIIIQYCFESIIIIIYIIHSLKEMQLYFRNI